MFLGIFSPSILAAGLDSSQKTLTDDPAKSHANEIVEIESLRESNVKHFRLPDGSYKAVVYSQAIHRKDNFGKWIDIDNNLTEETKDGNLQYSTSDSRIKFIHNENNYPSMILSDDSYSISMQWIGDTGSFTQKTLKSTGENKKPMITNSTQRKTNTFTSLEEATYISNKASIRYENLRDSTDIEYILIGNDIKENIILYSKNNDYSYEFQLDLTGLLPSVNTDGSISLNDENTGETKYSIPAPYMYDSSGSISRKVAYSIKENSQHSYSLTVCADKNWINSSERVFPITIDPTIQSTEPVYDTYISSANPNTNYGLSEELWISSSNITFIKIELPGTIPQGSTITNGTLNLPFYYYSSVTSGSLNIGAYEIAFPWEEYEITWNIANENQNMGISPFPFATANLSAANSNGVNNPGIATLDITDQMQFWIDGDPNFGIALKYISGTNSSVILRSWEYSNSAESYYCITYYPLIDITLPTNVMGMGGEQQAVYSTYPAGLTPTWSSSNTSVATVNSNGLITAHSKGTARITASCYDSDSGNTYTDSVYVSVYDSTGIQNNTSYYIMNYFSKRLLSLESVSDSAHTNVCTQPRNTATIARWTIEKQSDGRFQFISDYSPTDKCLNVNGTNIDIYNNTEDNYVKFAIDRVQTGTYQGLYLIRYGNYYLAQSNNYNVYLTTSRSDAAYWSFMAVEKRSADLFSFFYPDQNSSNNYNSTANNLLFTTVFNSKNFLAHAYVNETPAHAYNAMTTSDDIFVFRGHGNPGIVGFYDENGNHKGYLSADAMTGFYYDVTLPQSSIANIEENGLASLRVVLYLGCNTGGDITIGDTTYNLVDATFEKGAHFVLGTTTKIRTWQGDDWLEYFLESISTGANIQQAIDDANYILNEIIVPYTKEDGSEENVTVYGLPIYYVGDASQYLSIE